MRTDVMEELLGSVPKGVSVFDGIRSARWSGFQVLASSEGDALVRQPEDAKSTVGSDEPTQLLITRWAFHRTGADPTGDVFLVCEYEESSVRLSFKLPPKTKTCESRAWVRDGKVFEAVSVICQ
jgi:hypothetical protein